MATGAGWQRRGEHLTAGPSTDNAAALLALHAGPGFVLPDAWDAGSARILKQVGFPAIATTSAGIAWSCGEGTIRELAAAVPGPLNVVAGLANTIDAPTLFSLGVKRVSLGASLARAGFGMSERAGGELREAGTLNFLDGAIAYADLQRRFGS